MSKKKELIPELRFHEFKNEKPWKIISVSDVCDIYRGSTFSKADIDENGIKPCIHYGELFTKYNEVISTIYSRTDKGDGFKSEAGDVLMPSSDVTPNGLAKASAIAFSNVILGGDINILRQKKSINSIFLSYLLNHSKNEIIKLVSGTTVKHIYPSQIATLQLPIAHSGLEQQKIASCLSALDEVITTESQKLELLKDHQKGLMQNLFPQDGEKVPKFRFKEFEKDGEWKEKKLDSLTDKIGDGIHATPKYDVSGKFYFINGNNLIDGKIVVDDKTKRVSTSEFEIHKKDLTEKTILLSINGTIGNVALYNNEKVVLGKSACYLIPTIELNNVFLYYSLQSPKISGYFISELTGSTIKNLSLKSIRETAISLPFEKEQQKIASCLSALDELITAQTEKIEQLKLHKKGLMQNLFPKMND